MVRRDGPSARRRPRLFGSRERQLPLLLDVFHNQWHNQVQMDMHVCAGLRLIVICTQHKDWTRSSICLNHK